jgi:hypothetical protein
MYEHHTVGSQVAQERLQRLQSRLARQVKAPVVSLLPTRVTADTCGTHPCRALQERAQCTADQALTDDEDKVLGALRIRPHGLA